MIRARPPLFDTGISNKTFLADVRLSVALLNRTLEVALPPNAVVDAMILFENPHAEEVVPTRARTFFTECRKSILNQSIRLSFSVQKGFAEDKNDSQIVSDSHQ